MEEKDPVGKALSHQEEAVDETKASDEDEKRESHSPRRYLPPQAEALDLEAYDELYHEKIPDDFIGLEVRDVMRSRLQMSRKIIRKLVEGRGVLVNDHNVWLSTRLEKGDVLRLLLPTEESETILPEPIPFTNVYEDDDVLVVDKQAGILVHPTLGHWTGTLANGVVYDWQQRGIKARFRPVHRIDGDTTGLLVIAKNHYALKILGQQMMERSIERSYASIVHGVVAADHGVVDGPIDRSDEDFKVRVVRPEGKPARTEYWVRERFAQGTLLELKLHTGRTHQIRVHMKHIGHILFGDSFYGETDDTAWIARQALHAKVLGFVHPRTNEYMRFESPLPDDMLRLAEKLRV
ncbi:MAG TPA: RluA family pseudouridine synthase [Bacilli bacterium]|nr:RluA family pseudouridine synthase [Bacilli bacterium]